jgi:hypothetical protein
MDRRQKGYVGEQLSDLDRTYNGAAGLRSPHDDGAFTFGYRAGAVFLSLQGLNLPSKPRQCTTGVLGIQRGYV